MISLVSFYTANGITNPNHSDVITTFDNVVVLKAKNFDTVSVNDYAVVTKNFKSIEQAPQNTDSISINESVVVIVSSGPVNHDTQVVAITERLKDKKDSSKITFNNLISVDEKECVKFYNYILHAQITKCYFDNLKSN